MGKKTLYHPVSVAVLRGAMEYCGIQPGRLRQLFSSRHTASAIYTCDIVAVPKGLWGHQMQEIATAIQACFASDVDVIQFGQEYDVANIRSRMWIKLRTTAQPDEGDQSTE